MTVTRCQLISLQNHLGIDQNAATAIYHIEVDDETQGAYSAVDQATWGLAGVQIDGLDAYLPQKYQAYGVSVGTPPANPPPGGAPPHRNEADAGCYATSVQAVKHDNDRKRFIATVQPEQRRQAESG